MFTLSVETRDPDLAERVARAIAGLPGPADFGGKAEIRRDLAEANAQCRRSADAIADLNTHNVALTTRVSELLREREHANGEIDSRARALVVANTECARLRDRLEIAGSLCTAAQKWEGPIRARSVMPLTPDSGPITSALLDACALYEHAMTALADHESEQEMPF